MNEGHSNKPGKKTTRERKHLQLSKKIKKRVAKLGLLTAWGKVSSLKTANRTFREKRFRKWTMPALL